MKHQRTEMYSRVPHRNHCITLETSATSHRRLYESDDLSIGQFQTWNAFPEG